MLSKKKKNSNFLKALTKWLNLTTQFDPYKLGCISFYNFHELSWIKDFST